MSQKSALLTKIVKLKILHFLSRKIKAAYKQIWYGITKTKGTLYNFSVPSYLLTGLVKRSDICVWFNHFFLSFIACELYALSLTSDTQEMTVT